MGGSVGQSSSQQQTQAAPPPWAAAAGQQAMQAAQSLQQMPFRISPQPIAPLQAQQAEAFQSVENLQGAYTPFADIGAWMQSPQGASQYFNAESAGVLPELENVFGQQMAQTTGDLINKAGGPDAERIAVAQGELANQQGLAAGQTLSQLMGQAVGQGQSAGTNLASIGQTGQNMAQGAAQAELSAGTLQQQQLQNQQNALYQNQLQAISWPFQTTGFLSEVAAGLTPSMGGTMNQQGQMKSSSLGGSLGGLGGMGKASGGRIPKDVEDIVARLHGRPPKKADRIARERGYMEAQAPHGLTRVDDTEYASGGGVPESFGKGGSTNNGPDPGTIDQGAALPLSGPPGYFPSWVATPGAEEVPPGADPWKYGAIGEGAYLFPTQPSYASGAGPPVMPDRNPWLGGGPAQWPTRIPTLENAYNIDVGDPNAAASGVASGLFKANSPQAFGAEKQVFGRPQYGQQTGFADIQPTSDYAGMLQQLMSERSALTSQLPSGNFSAIPGEAQLPVSQQQARPQFSARGGRIGYADGGGTPESFKGGGTADGSGALAVPPSVAAGGPQAVAAWPGQVASSQASPFSPVNWSIFPGPGGGGKNPIQFLYQPNLNGKTPFGGINIPAGTNADIATTNDPTHPTNLTGKYYSGTTTAPNMGGAPQDTANQLMPGSMASAASQAAPTFGINNLLSMFGGWGPSGAGSAGGKGSMPGMGGSQWGGGSQANMSPWMTPQTQNTAFWPGWRGGRTPMQGGGLPGGVGGGNQPQQQAAGMQVPSLTSTPSGVSFMPGQGQVVSDPNIKPGPQGIKPKLGPPPPAPKPPEQGGGGKGGKGKKGGQGQQDQGSQDGQDQVDQTDQGGDQGGKGGEVGTPDPGGQSGAQGLIGDPGMPGASGTSSPGQPFGGVGGMQGGTSPFGLSGLESMDAGAGGAGGGMSDMSAMADSGGGSDFGGGGMKGGEARGGAIRGYDDGGDTGGDFGSTSAADAFDAFDAGMYTTGLGDSPGPGFAPHPDSGGPGIGGEQGRQSTAPAPQTPFSGPPGGGAAYGFGGPWNMGRMQEANAASTWAPTNNVPDASLAGTGSGHSLFGERQASPSPPTPVPAPAAGPGPSPPGASGTTSRPLDRNPGDPIIAPQVTQAWDAIKRNAPTWLHNVQGPQTVFSPGAGTPFGQRWPDTVSRETSPIERKIDDTNAAIAKAAGLQGYGGGSPTQQQAPPGQQPSVITPTGTERAIGQQVLANAMRGHPHTGWTPQGWVQAGPTRGDPMHVASAAVPLPPGDTRRQPVGEPVTPWQTQPTAITPTDTERAMGRRDLAQAMSAVPRPGQGYGGGAAESSLAQVQGPGGQQWASMRGDREKVQKALELASPSAETPAQPAAAGPGTEPAARSGYVPVPMPRPASAPWTAADAARQHGIPESSIPEDAHTLSPAQWVAANPGKTAMLTAMYPEQAARMAAANASRPSAIERATQAARAYNEAQQAPVTRGNTLMPPERFAPQRTDNVLTPRDTQALRQGAAPGQTAMPRVVERPPGTVPNMPDNLPNNAVGRAIHNAATRYGLNPRFMAAVAHIESAFVPSSNFNRATQYKGLFQMGRDEWRQYGNGQNIYDAEANADAASRMMRDHIERFRHDFGRDPTPGEAYLIHQQGYGWHTGAHIPANHIAGNPYPGMRGPQSHDSFTRGWTGRVNQLMGRPGGDDSESPAEFSSVRFASGGAAHFDDGGDTDDASFSDRFNATPASRSLPPSDPTVTPDTPALTETSAQPTSSNFSDRLHDAQTPAVRTTVERPPQQQPVVPGSRTPAPAAQPAQPVQPAQSGDQQFEQGRGRLHRMYDQRKGEEQNPLNRFLLPLLTGDPYSNFKMRGLVRSEHEGQLNEYLREVDTLTNPAYRLPGLSVEDAATHALGSIDGLKNATKKYAEAQQSAGEQVNPQVAATSQPGAAAVGQTPTQPAASHPTAAQPAPAAGAPPGAARLEDQMFSRMMLGVNSDLSNPAYVGRGRQGLAALSAMALSDAQRQRVQVETQRQGLMPIAGGLLDIRPDGRPMNDPSRFINPLNLWKNIAAPEGGPAPPSTPAIGGAPPAPAPTPMVATPAPLVGGTPAAGAPAPPPPTQTQQRPIPAGPQPAPPQPAQARAPADPFITPQTFVEPRRAIPMPGTEAQFEGPYHRYNMGPGGIEDLGKDNQKNVDAAAVRAERAANMDQKYGLMERALARVDPNDMGPYAKEMMNFRNATKQFLGSAESFLDLPAGTLTNQVHDTSSLEEIQGLTAGLQRDTAMSFGRGGGYILRAMGHVAPGMELSGPEAAARVIAAGRAQNARDRLYAEEISNWASAGLPTSKFQGWFDKAYPEQIFANMAELYAARDSQGNHGMLSQQIVNLMRHDHVAAREFQQRFKLSDEVMEYLGAK